MEVCYAYLRVGGKSQIEGDGFPRQALAIEAYAATNNITIVKTFQEEGISGAEDAQHRPALTDLIAALHSDGVKKVLIESLSRLARDLLVQEAIIRDLRNSDFTIVSVTRRRPRRLPA